MPAMDASLLLLDLCVLKENAAPEGALDHQAAKLSLKKILRENEELESELLRIRGGNGRAMDILAGQQAQPGSPAAAPAQACMELAPGSPAQPLREPKMHCLHQMDD